MATAPTHLMELPRKILIGDGVISSLGAFIRDIGYSASKVAIVTGNTVKSRASADCKSSFQSMSIDDTWYVVIDSSIASVDRLKRSLAKDLPDIIIGFGGGRAVDVAKMTAFQLNKPFVSVPTSASHDGISSPFASIRGSKKPYSIKTNTPLGVLADTTLLAEAPTRLMASGCGDLVAKITAIKDWELARDENNEYFGTYAANLAYMSAKIILDESKKLGARSRSGIRIVVEALISAGVAACIAGSSRPCSGAEHLFSHAVDYIVGQNYGLHGERVGIGTIMMAKLHNVDWEIIVQTLERVGAPTKAKQIRLSEEQIVLSLLAAPSLRPDRYTILSKANLNKSSASELARSVKVI
ncbi:MAG TPA: sn-glycerol-1-phosphate dehydrogenase [Candidatus Nitrosopolaris sp.]|nr:sn-glycerol-1-phosphate dehydrogenase [Candidatus Nitrosopolaris sp.]